VKTPSRARRRRSRAAALKQGLPPGTPVYAGEELPDVAVAVRVMDYSAAEVQESDALRTDELKPHRDSPTVTWINLDGIHQVEQVQAVCRTFGVHALWVEDILNPSSRPKTEVMDDKILVITRMARAARDPSAGLSTEQVAMVLGPSWVLTFQEQAGDVWDALRQRIRSGGGRIRRMRADYLLHALLDAVVDHYFISLEALEGRVDTLEDGALDGLPVDLRRVHEQRRELAAFREVVWPTREAIAALLKRDSEAIGQDILPYYRDLYDHVVQVMDILETSRERLVGVFELHLAVNGHQLNQIMRVLTVVSTVFIPLTFIAGVYGMNFKHMPELEWAWAYPAVWALMVATALGMAHWFRTRQWM
jgi:magnesium transporter